MWSWPAGEAYLGNIYKAKVVNIEPSIGAAFVNFGGQCNGFLHASDVLPAYSREDLSLQDVIEGRAQVTGEDGPDVVRSVLDDDDDGEAAGARGRAEGGAEQAAAAAEANGAATEVAVEAEPDAEAAPAESEVDEEPEEAEAAAPEAERRGGRGRRGSQSKRRARRERPKVKTPIDQLVRRGQELVVQVTKEGIGAKGPALTTYVSLPGRSLVLMPSLPKCGVSRKIDDLKERRR